MPLLFPSLLDYTDKDEASLRIRLRKLAKSAFPGWTNFEYANFGNVLLESMANVGGLATYYLDAQAGESRWATAQHRSSLLSLVKLIAYKPRGAKSASVDIKLTFLPPPAHDVVIENGDLWQTESATPVRFEIVEDYVVPANTVEFIITGAHRLSRSEVFASTGLPNQELVLSHTPFLTENFELADAGGQWLIVDDFTDSTALDRHVTATVDSNERATIRFGNGINGSLPQGSIEVTYYTGGGSGGLVEVNTVKTPLGSYTDVQGNPVYFTSTNPAESSGYADIESEAEIREKAPESLRALNRTVSREDFELNAKQVPGVGRALMLTSNEDAAIAENSGILFIVPLTGSMPSQELKDAVITMITETKPHTLTFKPTVSDPVYATVAIKARVYLKPKVTNATGKAAILKALQSFFALVSADGSTNTSIDFGFNYKNVDNEPTGELALSTVMNVVRNADGIAKIGDSTSDFLVNLKHQDLPIGIKAFPRLGTVTLTNGDTGEAM